MEKLSEVLSGVTLTFVAASQRTDVGAPNASAIALIRPVQYDYDRPIHSRGPLRWVRWVEDGFSRRLPPGLS